METFLIKAAQLILALVILVTVHEFGHYIFARIFGMRVDRFYLFFNPWFSIAKYDPRKGTVQLVAWTKKTRENNDKDAPVIETPKSLFTFKVGKSHPADPNAKPTWRDTIYGLGWLPLGGYCSIAGMIDETTDADKLSAEPQPWEFRAKKPWPRLMVMIAGVLLNFILAIIIYIGIAWHWGDKVIQFSSATEGLDYVEQLQKAGFKDGDIPLTVDGQSIDVKKDKVIWDMVQDGAEITVLRNHKDTISFTIPQGTLASLSNLDEKGMMDYRYPVIVKQISPGEGAAHSDLSAGDYILKVNNDTIPSFSEFGPTLAKYKGNDVTVTFRRNNKVHTTKCHINNDGKIGIMASSPAEIYPVEIVEYSFLESIPKGVSDGVDKLTMYVSSLKMLFTKQGAESVGGFGAIGDLYPNQWNWYAFWNITAFLSVILAFMNILPIPALDGGHVLFTLWEIITRRKPSEKFLEYAQMAGMAFLFLLLIYANGNDIYRFFFK